MGVIIGLCDKILFSSFSLSRKNMKREKWWLVTDYKPQEIPIVYVCRGKFLRTMLLITIAWVNIYIYMGSSKLLN